MATARPGELASHELASQVLFELDEDGLLSRIELGPLDRVGLQQLAEAVIDQPAPAPLITWLSNRSRGNPLFAIGLLRALVEERADLYKPHLERLPESLADRVELELRRFDPPWRELLELSAVLGRPVSLGELTTLTDEPLERLGPVLTGLVETRMVLEDERGVELSYELQHPLVRDIIYQSTSATRRRILHRQAARLLRSVHARRATVKFRLANFLAWGTGDLEAASAACEQARELFTRAGEERQALLAARELAWIKGLRGDLTGMGEDAHRVVRAAEALPDRFVVMQGLSAVAYSENFRGALAEGEAALRRAVTIAREDEKSYRLTVALSALAAGLAFQGRVAETTALFEEAKALNAAYRESILIELETLVDWRPSAT